MSGIGERDDAPEVEVDADVEVEGPDEPGSDEGDADGDQGDGADGDVDSEQDDNAGEGEGQADRSAEVKPRSAATIAVQEAKRAAKAAREDNDRLRAEMAEIQRERQGRQTQEQQRLEQERVALMAPEEKFEYLLRKQEEGFNARFGALQYNQHDSADRTAFEARCARVPAFDAIRDDVEASLAKARQAGGNPTRETVATYLIGQRAIERAAKGGKAKQSAKGQANISRQTVKAPAGRSDVRGGNQRSGGGEAAARAERLSKMDI